MGDYRHVAHTFGPVYDEHSRILILGSFPSEKSRESGFYYGNPKNRFWRVMADVCREPAPPTVEDKRQFLLDNGIALWDVIESCDIVGSADSSIRNVVANDMDEVLSNAPICEIFANGEMAYRLFLQYCKRDGQPPVEKLPSTSPANARWSVARLEDCWGAALCSVCKGCVCSARCQGSARVGSAAG